MKCNISSRRDEKAHVETCRKIRTRNVDGTKIYFRVSQLKQQKLN